MKNLFYLFSKLLLHIISAYIGYFAAIKPITGWFNKTWADKNQWLIIGLCITLLLIIEKVYSDALRGLIDGIKYKSSKGLGLVVFGLIMAGGASITATYYGSYKTPFYDRDIKTSLYNVDSLESELNTRLLAHKNTYEAEKLKAESDFIISTKVYTQMIQSYPKASAYYQAKIDEQSKLKNKRLSDIQGDYSMKYSRDTSYIMPKVRMFVSKNESIKVDRLNQDEANGDIMAIISILMQVFMIYFTIATKPLRFKITNPFAKFSFVTSIVSNNVTNIINRVTIGNQIVTLEILLKEADAKTKQYFENGLNVEGKKELAEAMIPLLVNGNPVNTLNKMCANKGYSTGTLSHIKNRLAPLLANKGLIQVEAN